MAVQQIQAVTGRKIRPNYTDKINAKAALLPEKYRAKESQRVNDANIALGKESLALEKEQFGLQKKQMRRANTINYANLGIGAAGALGQYLNSDDGGAVEPVANAVGSLAGSAGDMMGGGEAFIKHDGLLEADSGVLGAVDDYLLTPAAEGLGWIDDNLLGGCGGKFYDKAASAVTSVWEGITGLFD